MPDKLCPTCKTLKPTAEFHKDKSKIDGLCTYCKPCMVARQKSYAGRPARHQAPEGMKRCSHCKETKAITEFFASAIRFDGLDRRCRTCCGTLHDQWRRKNLPAAAAAGRKWRAENPERSKDHGRKKNYDLPLGTYDRMLAQQNGKCAICFAESAGGKGAFHVDHCHDSGKVRGLLCHECNLGLGKFKDRADLLTSAINYLAERGGES